MADPNFFPGFEGEDEAKKQPAKPAKPVSAAPAKPAFDPFADAPKPAATPPAVAKPPTGRVAKAPAPAPAQAATSSSAPAADDDPELKPGSRKDLWKCPHCGAGNKPDRNTCRTCGKSPDDPVIVPWYANNVIRAGILAAIGVVIVVIVMLTRVDVTLREPNLADVDRKPRIGGSATGSIDLGGGLRFEADHQISVCGRVAAVGVGPGGTVLVALALGPAAAQEKPKATASDGSFEVEGVVLACSVEGEFKPIVGQILSVQGATGDLVKDGRITNEPAGVIPVAVENHRAK